ncbi:hypothetical protein PHYC_02960 [Phycisphaerales bacterium]|nr:hypothetical protein PHYC_02960 [Phycisphaerales bacterium]
MVGADLFKVVDRFMDDFYSPLKAAVRPDGTYDLSLVDLNRIPKIGDIMALKYVTFPERLKHVGLAGHHVDPKYLVKMLIAEKNPTWTASQIEARLGAIANDMPGLLVHAVDHTGTPRQGSASFHSILSRSTQNGGHGLRPVKWLPDDPTAIPTGPPYSSQSIFDGLRQAYADWGRPEVGAAAFKWFEQAGLYP